ncbi:recombinase family protein [Serratia fonticola]|uniref:recombinase family protein n=1 Tax=Serratia fonticola TaxID=47917 RepID=UPI00192C37B6|nr:recombinase family protein [Serratia fonticola]MBL5906127.1 recombinase family protein [Serratia fonticola]
MIVKSGQKTRIRAAKYLRMSTENQQYSFHNQSDFIQGYADKNDMDILYTYDDAGKSGVTLSGRLGLQRLIDDVIYRKIEIDVVLVYDVSRFGRFQNTDESAHYNYLFTMNNVKVIYCAEPFSDEHPEMSMLMLNMQRTGAANLSKGLSEKVFAGQVNLVKRGYHQGGTAGYGLRRELIDEHHTSKGTLDFGQRKSIQTDRVILKPGPSYEVDIVGEIFDMFIFNSKPEFIIAIELNERCVIAENGGLWTRGKVHQILTNEKYIGNSVYNRKSFKLKRKHITNPEHEWIRCDNAFEPIVSLEKFLMAKEIILARSSHLTDEQLLDSLKKLLATKGNLSGFIIDEEELLPSSSVYRNRFGGLLKVYKLINYKPSQDYSYIEINEHLREYHCEVIDSIVKRVQEFDGLAKQIEDSKLLYINGELKLSIIIARCRKLPSGSLRWKVRFDRTLLPDISIAVRMDISNKYPIDYFIFPSIDNLYTELSMKETNIQYLDFYRFDTLNILFNLLRRTNIKEFL